MSRREASSTVQAKSIKKSPKVAETGLNDGSAFLSKRVDGFLIYDTPIQPKHFTRAQIAAAIDRLR